MTKCVVSCNSTSVSSHPIIRWVAYAAAIHCSKMKRNKQAHASHASSFTYLRRFIWNILLFRHLFYILCHFLMLSTWRKGVEYLFFTIHPPIDWVRYNLRKVCKDDSAFNADDAISSFRFEVIVDSGRQIFAVVKQEVVFLLKKAFFFEESYQIVHRLVGSGRHHLCYSREKSCRSLLKLDQFIK